jgi:hypothetical protein
MMLPAMSGRNLWPWPGSNDPWASEEDRSEFRCAEFGQTLSQLGAWSSGAATAGQHWRRLDMFLTESLQ